MRSRYKSIYTGNPYFITSSIVNWVEIFTSDKYFRILIDAIKYNRDKRNLEISAYVLMKNHFHLICRSDKLANAVSSIKSYSAKKIIQQLKEDNRFNILKLFEQNKLPSKKDRQYQIWQEGFHPQELTNEKIYRQKLNYIHNNPITAGYVDDILKWEYCSAVDYYEEKEGVIKLDCFT